MPEFTILLGSDIPAEALPRLMDALADLQPEMQQIADIGGEYQRANFGDEGETFGDSWPTLKYATLKEKERIGASSETLVRPGRLQEAVGQTISLSSTSVSVGINLADFPTPYPLYHQLGAGHNPVRVLVSVSEQEIDEMIQSIQQTLSDAAGLPEGAIQVQVAA